MLKCTKCPLGEKVKSNCIDFRGVSPGSKPKKAKFLFVGKAPGFEEEKKNTPFVGESGRLLIKALHLLESDGLDLSQVALTTAVKCFPGLTKDGNISKPRIVSIRECQHWLKEEVRTLAPEVIVCLGALALGALVPEAKGGVFVNRAHQFEFLGVPTFVTLHPEACLRNPAWRRDLLDDLSLYLIKQNWKKESKNIPVTLVNNPKKLNAALKVVDQSSAIGLDIETVGFSTNILTIGVSTDV